MKTTTANTTRFQVAHISDRLGYGPKFTTRKWVEEFRANLAAERKIDISTLVIIEVCA